MMMSLVDRVSLTCVFQLNHPKLQALSLEFYTHKIYQNLTIKLQNDTFKKKISPFSIFFTPSLFLTSGVGSWLRPSSWTAVGFPQHHWVDHQDQILHGFGPQVLGIESRMKEDLQ